MEVLDAVANGDEEWSTSAARSLADAVSRHPAVALANEVLGGGALALHRAFRLRSFCRGTAMKQGTRTVPPSHGGEATAQRTVLVYTATLTFEEIRDVHVTLEDK